MSTFNQLYESILYTSESQSGDIGWFGYIYNTATSNSGDAPKSGVKLSDLFSTDYPDGVFIFSTSAPDVSDETSANAFANLVLDYLIDNYGDQGKLNSYAIIWLDDTSSIESSTTQVVTLSYFNTFSVNDPLSYNPRNSIEVSIQKATPVELKEDQFHFFNTVGQNPTINLKSTIQGNSTDEIPNLYIPTSGPLMGVLVFNIQIGSSHYDFPRILTSINYFYPGENSTPVINSYAVFDSTTSFSNSGNYYFGLDPNNQLNANDQLRSFIVPVNSAFDTVEFPSGFSTDSGLQLGLSAVPNLEDYPNVTLFKQPTDNTGMLVFVQNMDDTNYEIVPQGQYSLSMWGAELSSTAATQNLLAGLSGIETFSIVPATKTYTGDLLTFVTGKGAYAKDYVPPSSDNDTSGADLDTTYKTAWVAVEAGVGSTDDNLYYSQPTGASLYASGFGVNKTVDSLLGFFEPVTCTLKNGSTPVPVPMAPYRELNPGTSSAQEDINDFELRVLSTNRKSELEETIQQLALERTSRVVDEDTPTDLLIKSTSPQGLLVEVDTGTNAWNELVLAKNINPETSQPITMEFKNLNSKLQSAFQTNQQFLVISWNKPITEGGDDNILCGPAGGSCKDNFLNEMSIEGWPFIADVPKSDPNGVFTNVLIFKFCDGALIDRANDTSTWTSPELFNSDQNNNMSLLQSWITDYCNTGINKAKSGDNNYEYFSRIVQDPNWNGILLLESDISVQDFPEELQGLLAGIDLTRFKGHHMGINVNHIEVGTDGELSMAAQSSLFGLIDYTDQVFDQYDDNIEEYLEYVSPPKGDYNYKVLSLRVLFENSIIQNFDSYVQLAINRLFESEVTASNNDNIIIFTGTYEDQDGVPNYVFNETGVNLLPIKSNVLSGVEIIKSNFVTKSPQVVDGATMVTVLFSFWGFLNFAEQDFDLYSFGSAKDSKGGNQFIAGDGLSYSNMTIEMSFALETSTVQFFTFSVDQMAFDLGQSNSRTGSLYSHFPLELTGILTGDTSSQPSSQGYIPLPIDGMGSTDTWSGTWYGIVFNLNMGTMGDLTDSLGFNSTMMMVWTAGETSPTGAMLQLPGLGTESKSLSLQGVLNLNIGNLLLQSAVVQDTGDPAYMMSMNKITLKLLSFSFPPSGSVDFYLFGDPNPGSSASSLGWYLGYQSGADESALCFNKTSGTKKIE